MNIPQIACRSFAVVAVISAAMGLFGCGQQQPAEKTASPQVEARETQPTAPATIAEAETKPTEPAAIPQAETPPIEKSQPKAVASPKHVARKAEAPASTPQEPSQQIASTPTVEKSPPARRVTVPEGSQIHVKLDSPVGSATSHVGDTFTATTSTAVLVGDEVVIPAGSTIHGRVASIEAATKGLKVAEKGAAVVLAFTKLTMPNGESAPLSASLTSAANSSGKTAGIIGGSAAGGAILGKLLGGHSKDAAIGAVIGGGIGTGVAAGTKGKEVVLPAGTDLSIALDQALTITKRS